MPARLKLPDTAFQAPKQRRPRVRVEDHLEAIRRLPCVVCHSRPVEAAHIRMALPSLGKRQTGLQEKPSDHWCLPLCPMCHRRQHSMSERKFWQGRNISPGPVALALWAARGDEEMQEQIAVLAASAAQEGNHE